MLAEFSYTRAYQVTEEPVEACITSISYSGSGRGNLELHLSGEHCADGARRAFKLRGFGGGLALINANWKSDAVSNAAAEQPWVKLNVKGPITQQLVEVEAVRLQQLLAAVPPRTQELPYIDAVFNLAGEDGALSHLTLQRVTRNGQELDAQEAQQLLAGAAGGGCWDMAFLRQQT